MSCCSITHLYFMKLPTSTDELKEKTSFTMERQSGNVAGQEEDLQVAVAPKGYVEKQRSSSKTKNNIREFSLVHRIDSARDRLAQIENRKRQIDDRQVRNYISYRRRNYWP